MTRSTQTHPTAARTGAPRQPRAPPAARRVAQQGAVRAWPLGAAGSCPFSTADGTARLCPQERLRDLTLTTKQKQTTPPHLYMYVCLFPFIDKPLGPAPPRPPPAVLAPRRVQGGKNRRAARSRSGAAGRQPTGRPHANERGAPPGGREARLPPGCHGDARRPCPRAARGETPSGAGTRVTAEPRAGRARAAAAGSGGERREPAMPVLAGGAESEAGIPKAPSDERRPGAMEELEHTCPQPRLVSAARPAGGSVRVGSAGARRAGAAEGTDGFPGAFPLARCAGRLPLALARSLSFR